ncbi:MAG: membrane protein insertion efficiency factor YidD [Candidatus Doudnabacteria bacterium]|nr:membrane protein insertion efficiency factor YidD [Candidatus Doudnabacteria bacterium]
MEIIKQINKVLGLPLVLLVSLYQKTLSPDHGLTKVFYPHGYCKFYPSCSEYARITLTEQGATGLPKIAVRIMKCNPLSTGGMDLPKKV